MLILYKLSKICSNGGSPKSDYDYCLCCKNCCFSLSKSVVQENANLNLNNQ